MVKKSHLQLNILPKLFMDFGFSWSIKTYFAMARLDLASFVVAIATKAWKMGSTGHWQTQCAYQNLGHWIRRQLCSEDDYRQSIPVETALGKETAQDLLFS